MTYYTIKVAVFQDMKGKLNTFKTRTLKICINTWASVKTCQNKACVFRETGHNHIFWKMEHLLCHLGQGF